ncbi:MAG: 3-hydroxyacyl-ACP dehydratase FabZ [Nitrospirae bacterium]|nr:3-hydroxyacyl-ACP dehydratase FabZ [Nitrospirota bacterium]
MLDILEIQKILPHRYPFLLIDQITEMELGKKIVGIKNVTANEAFFEGHYPNCPIMPEVMIIEALAQVGGVLAFKSAKSVEGCLVYFLSIDKAEFRKTIIPGNQIILQMEVLQARLPYWKLMGKALVKEELVCQAELKAMISNQKI